MGARDSESLSLTECIALEAQARDGIKAETDEVYREAYAPIEERIREAVTPGIPATGPNTCFFLHSSVYLAHVQMMLQVIRPNDYVAILNEVRDGYHLPAHLIRLSQCPLPERFEELRRRLTEEKCGRLIWVGPPLYANYAFRLRLAKQQVFWTLRFHGTAPGDINLTAGKRGEKSRTYHGREWRTVHAPFNLDSKAVDLNACERRRGPWPFIYGTLAREQKIMNPQYLDAVCRILEENTDTGFTWAAKRENPAIRRYFRDRGLGNRHKFVGWSDVDEFMNQIDCFLETFPLGGVTTFNAMAHQVPVVALRQEYSPMGSLERVPVGSGLVDDVTGYVDAAVRLRHDVASREANIKAGEIILASERARAGTDRAAFWRALAEVTRSCKRG